MYLPGCRHMNSTATCAAAVADAPVAAPVLPYRVGHGFDLHRLAEGYKLIIGGVEIPHTKGCEAHSDGVSGSSCSSVQFKSHLQGCRAAGSCKWAGQQCAAPGLSARWFASLCADQCVGVAAMIGPASLDLPLCVSCR